MKYIKQFVIIIMISFIGELLNKIIPLSIPASIYGLVIMLTALITKVIPLSSIKETGKFLVEIMPLMFIPAAVGLLDLWDVLRPMFIPVAIITIMSTIIVMVVTGRITQRVIGVDSTEEAE
ncbi:MAG: CidA/LrgA family protein [Clostridium sp.]|nr:CidA/LrgA family protein [Clostridium sp.]